MGSSGFDARSSNMLRTASDNGYRVTLLDCSISTEPGLDIFGLEHIRLHLPSEIRFFKRWLLFLWRGLRLVRQIKADLTIASDLYSLPVAFWAGKKVIYDSREVYAGLTPQNGSILNRWFLKTLERFYIYRCRSVIVTGSLDAAALENRYGQLPVKVILNLPLFPGGRNDNFDIRETFGIGKAPLLMYQGMLNRGRGLEKAIQTIQLLEGWHLVIAGGGPLEKALKESAGLLLGKRIHFTGFLPYNVLLSVCNQADIGWVFIEPVSESYRLALPNKLFEFIASGVPVLVSDLPAMRNVIEEYQTGDLVHPDAGPGSIAEVLQKVYRQRAVYSQYCAAAAPACRWESQERELLKILES
jgi:glycosyltransferase involved in cell wall biosynthesis